MARRTCSAHELIEQVLDPESFQSWDVAIDLESHPAEYRRQLEAAARRAGTDEAVITGRGSVRGRPVAVIVSEFGFLGGSIGRAAVGRITAAVTRATAERLPLLASTASGGTRMQEGTPAFVGMIEICRALMRHRAERLPYLVHLRNPTTGGVYASWGSLGQLTVAEPGALVAFLGPKVYAALHGEPFPPDVQTAENLAAKGVIDGVVATTALPELINRALSVLVDPPTPRAARPTSVVPTHRSAWSAIETTRRPDRIGVRQILRHGASPTVRLRGTDEGQRDESMLVALTRLDGRPCVVVGQDRSRQTPRTPLGPAALREARRGMRLAEEFGLPLITVIDTPGAELSVAAEEGAVAGEIARCIATLTTLTVPTVSVILGEGCGGAALALLPADHVIAAENAWLAPLPPEGASVIVYGDTSHAPELAERQRVAAADLKADGTVQAIVPEIGDDDPAAFARAVASACSTAIDHLCGVSSEGPRAP